MLNKTEPLSIVFAANIFFHLCKIVFKARTMAPLSGFRLKMFPFTLHTTFLVHTCPMA